MAHLRTSYQRQGKKISTIIQETLPNTFYWHLVPSLRFYGIILGILAGFKGSTLDNCLVFFSTFEQLTSFFSAILFSWIFGHVLKFNCLI